MLSKQAMNLAFKKQRRNDMVIRKGNKEVSFTNSYEANHFLGIDSGFEFEAICESTGIKLFAVQGPSHWDDGVEMRPSEWVEVARALMLGYSYGNIQIIYDYN